MERPDEPEDPRNAADSPDTTEHGIPHTPDTLSPNPVQAKKAEDLDLFFALSLDLLCIADTNGNFLSVNPQWEKTLGYRRNELEGHSFLDLVHPDDLEETLRAVAHLAEQKEILGFVNRYRHKDGSYRWIEWRSAPMGNRIYAAARDITERKNTEDALQQRLLALTRPLGDMATEELRFEDLFNLEEVQRIQDAFAEATGVASVITDITGTPITRTSRFCYLCEHIIRKTEKGRANCYHSDAVLGRMNPHGPIMQPCLSGGLWDGGTSICVGDRHIANWLIGQVLEEPVNTERMLQYARDIGADEHEFAEALNHVTRMSKTQFEKVCAALYLIARQLSDLAFQNVQQARTMAARERAEVALRESEEQYRFLADNSRDIIALFDRAATCLYISPACTTLLGFSPDEVVGQRAREFIYPNDLSDAIKYQKDILTGSTPAPLVHRLRTKDGGGVWFESSIQIVANTQNKEDLRFLAVCRDITERKRAEEKHRYLEAQVQQAQKMESLGILAGGIAHDFNNMLMAIIGNTELALHEITQDNPARAMLEEVCHTGRHAADLCKQMLAYSGKGRFVIAPLDISATVSDMQQMLRISVSKKATLEFALTDNLPSVEADITQIRQIILNLVINASEALLEKSGKIAVKTGVMHCDQDFFRSTNVPEGRPDGRYVYLEVTDTGCGMDPLVMKKIFDPFFSTKFTGRGLGLPAALGIAHGHKGAIRVTSEMGKGTSVLVVLPATDIPAQPLTVASPKEDDWRGSGMVLLVDDEDTVRSLCKRMLERLGFDVVTATNGREAVEATSQHDPALRCVLLDLTMPEMDGEETFYELRRVNPNIPVIMTSGYNEQDVASRFAGGRPAGFLQKPYNLAALRSTLKSTLSDSAE